MITRQDPVLLKPQKQSLPNPIYQQVLTSSGFEDDSEIREVVAHTLSTVVETLQVGLNGESYSLQALLEEAEALHESVDDSA